MPPGLRQGLWLVATVVLAGACVRGGFGPGLDAARQDPDAQAVDLKIKVDAPPQQNPWLGSFALSTPEPLSALNTAGWELEPCLTADNLTLHFARGATSQDLDVFRATRPDRSAPFGGVTPVAELNTTLQESRLFVLPDGVTGYLSAERPNSVGGADIWIVHRASASAPFDPTSLVNLPLNSVAHDWDPFLTEDGLQLFYCVSQHPDGPGGNELMVAARPSTTEPFASPTLIDELNSASNEGNPSLTADGLVLVFNTVRPGGLGGGDLCYATRNSPAEPFSSVKPVPGINTADREGEPFLSADGQELFFASDRPGGAGQMDIYRSWLEPLP
jgi:hypothetical protein